MDMSTINNHRNQNRTKGARNLSIGLSLLLTFLVWNSCLWAQVPTPGIVGESLRPGGIESLINQPPPVSTLPAPERLVAPVDDRRVQITRFTFSGNTLYTEDQLRTVIADLEGQELTLGEIYQAADRISDFFQQQGYNLTTATVPAQRMRDGILRLEVVEGTVGQLIFVGNERYASKLLERRLYRVKPGTIVRFDDLEREVLLLNDLPGLVARSVMLPGNDFGSTDIQLTAQEKIFGASLTLDNHGLEVVGKWRAAGDFYINNPLKYGDVFGFGYTHTQSGLLRQGRVSYGLPLWTKGTRLNLNYSRAQYDVGGDFSQLGISGISESARVQITHPQIRSRKTNLNWVGGGVRVSGSSDIDNLSLSDDTIYFLEAGFNFNHRFDGGSSATFSAMLATNFRSNSDGDDSKALPPRLELRGSYEYPFARLWSLFARGEAVWAADPMPDSNKYSIGGPASVRGFVSSSKRGDQGAMGSLELRRIFLVKQQTLQARTFFDAGFVNTKSSDVAESGSENLKSAGLGLTAFVAGRYMLDAAWAKPIGGDDSGEGRSSQFWMTLSAMF